MKKIVLTIVSLVLLPQVTFAQTSTSTVTTTMATTTVAAITTATTTVPQTPVTLKDPGLVPGDFFYFLDRLVESLNSFVTIRDESKAQVALEHAQERAAEIAVLIQKDGATSDDVKKIKVDFDNDVKKATTILSAKNKVDLNEDLKTTHEMLKQVYRTHHENIKHNEKQFREQMKQAIEKGDSALQNELDEKLKKIKEEKDVVVRDGNLENEMDDENDDENKDMRKDNEEATSQPNINAAQAHVENAQRAREQYVELTKTQKVEATQATKNTLATFDELLNKAKIALSENDTENAIEYAKDAIKVLDDNKQDLSDKDTEEEFFKDDKGR